MSNTVSLDSVKNLPLPDRLDVIFDLWDEFLDEGWEPDLDDELKAELDRRWANYQANPQSGRSWEHVLTLL